MASYTCYASQSAYTDEDSPNTNFSYGDTCKVEARYRTQSYTKAYFSFDNSAVKRKNIKSIRLSYYVTPSDFDPQRSEIIIFTLRKAFNENTITNRNGSPATKQLQSITPQTDPGWCAIPAKSNYEDVGFALGNGISVWWGKATIASSSGDRIANYDIKSSRSSSKPYLEVTADDIKLKVTNMSPRGYIQNSENVTFTWGTSPGTVNCVLETPKAASSKFRYRDVGETNYKEVAIPDGSNTYTLPMSKLGPIAEWQVVVTSDDGVEGTPSEWVQITNKDALSTPRIISPKNVAVDGMKPITFKWDYVIATGTQQTRYELEYSVDEGTTWTQFAAADTNETEYIRPAQTLPTGKMLWRVRTYNTDGEAGFYSTVAQILVNASPPAPIVTADTKPRPTIRWQVSEQQAFRVICGEYDSGIIPGTQKEFKVPVYLPDGETEIQVSVQGGIGLWSTPGECQTVIQNVSDPPFKTNVLRVKNGIKIIIPENAHYEKYYIYRDDTLIGKAEELEYYDYLTNGRHLYKVRGITREDYYTFSNELPGTTAPQTGVIAKTEDFDWLELKFRRGEKPGFTDSRSPVIAVKYYSGRRFPVIISSGYSQVSHTFHFTFNEPGSYEKLKGMEVKEVIYKDNFGELVVGTLTNIECTKTMGIYQVSFEIIETSQKPVNYDV